MLCVSTGRLRFSHWRLRDPHFYGYSVRTRGSIQRGISDAPTANGTDLVAMPANIVTAQSNRPNPRMPDSIRSAMDSPSEPRNIIQRLITAKKTMTERHERECDAVAQFKLKRGASEPKRDRASRRFSQENLTPNILSSKRNLTSDQTHNMFIYDSLSDKLPSVVV